MRKSNDLDLHQLTTINVAKMIIKEEACGDIANPSLPHARVAIKSVDTRHSPLSKIFCGKKFPVIIICEYVSVTQKEIVIGFCNSDSSCSYLH